MENKNIDLRIIYRKDVVFGERFREDYGNLDDLILSFKNEGIISPLAVKQDGDFYVLLAGGRRFRAATEAGIEEIPVRVYPESINELEMRSIELMENVIRKDLTWIEDAKLKREIHRLQLEIHGEKKSTKPGAEGWSIRDTANLLGKDQGGIVKDLLLADAIENFPQLQAAKNKFEANKIMDKMQEEIIRQEIAKRIAAKQDSTPIDSQHRSLINSYVVGDFFDKIRGIPDRSMDFIEVDPPYGIDLTKQKQALANSNYSQYEYNEVPVDEYVPFLTRLIGECSRVMSDNSWMIFWFGMDPWFEVIFQELMKAGLKGSRMVGIWNKEGMSTGQSMQPNLYLSNISEPFFYVRKGEPAITKQGRGNVFNYKAVHSSKKIHPTERPVELIQEILYTFSWEGARVLVPFLGSGNTLLAASNLGMQGVGFDLSEKYKDSFMINVVGSKPGSYRSYKEGT